MSTNLDLTWHRLADGTFLADPADSVIMFRAVIARPMPGMSYTATLSTEGGHYLDARQFTHLAPAKAWAVTAYANTEGAARGVSA